MPGYIEGPNKTGRARLTGRGGSGKCPGERVLIRTTSLLYPAGPLLQVPGPAGGHLTEGSAGF